MHDCRHLFSSDTVMIEVQLFPHCHPSTTLQYKLMPIWWWGHVFRKLCCVALPFSVSCIKSIAICHSPLSSHWWSLWWIVPRLWQRCPDTPPIYLLSSAASPQCSHVADFQLALLRPHLLCIREPLLSASSWTYQVQGCRTHLHSPPQLCTIIPSPVHLCCRPSKLQST